MNVKMLKAAFAGLVLSVSGFANAGLISGSGLIVSDEIDDYYFSTSGTGLVTIETFESINAGSDFDTEINLFFNDMLLDLTDFIQNDDDHDDDGSYSGLASLISISLDAGDYLLRVSTWDFGNSIGTDSIIIGATNPNGDADGTAYDIEIAGVFVVENGQGPSTSVPEPSTLAIFALGMIGLASRRFNKQS